MPAVGATRNRDLFAQKLITPKQFQEVTANFEVAQAAYQSLMDQMGYEAKLANTRAQQAKKQAETATRAARERLRILGIVPEETETEFAEGIRFCSTRCTAARVKAYSRSACRTSLATCCCRSASSTCDWVTLMRARRMFPWLRLYSGRGTVTPKAHDVALF